MSAAIRRRALVALAANRTPGYHFPAHFLGISFDAVARERTLLSLDPGEHCIDARGEVHAGAVAMLADLAMSASIRAGLHPAQRLGTVSLSMHLFDVPRAGRLEAQARFEGFVADARGRQGVSRFTLSSDGVPIGFGGGGFMVLDPPSNVTMHPVVLRTRADPLPEPLDAGVLDPAEALILGRVDAALQAAARSSFIDSFWGLEAARVARGASASVANGQHIGNRVGHAQGGLSLGLALAAAAAAFEHPRQWRVSALTAVFTSPMQGDSLQVESRLIHAGGLTGSANTLIYRRDGRLALKLVSNHAAVSV